VVVKRTMLVAAFCAVACVLVAQEPAGKVTLRGYLMDASCGAALSGKPTAEARAARHTKACALNEECAASGYGIMAEGKWVKFDARGDSLAKKAITASRRERGHYFEVTGVMRAERLAVQLLKEREK
jgi:hypothetical protein